MKRALPRFHQMPLARTPALTLLAGLAALSAVVAYLMVGGDLFRGALAYTGAILTAASLEGNGVGTVSRWAFALPVGCALYMLMLTLR